MRAKLLMGFFMTAAAAPLCVQADAVSKADLWNSWRAGPVASSDVARVASPDVVRTDAPPVAAVPLAMDAQVATNHPTAKHSGSVVAAIREPAVREPRTIRAVDTNMPRVFVAPAVRTISVASFSVPRVMTGSATTAPSRVVQATVAPEMNTGFAAAGLTLLLGGVAVLRSGRSRFNG